VAKTEQKENSNKVSTNFPTTIGRMKHETWKVTRIANVEQTKTIQEEEIVKKETHSSSRNGFSSTNSSSRLTENSSSSSQKTTESTSQVSQSYCNQNMESLQEQFTNKLSCNETPRSPTPENPPHTDISPTSANQHRYDAVTPDTAPSQTSAAVSPDVTATHDSATSNTAPDTTPDVVPTSAGPASPHVESTPSIAMTYEIDGVEYQLLPEHGLCARALFDYQAADDTEISFDPPDIVCNIERVDEGWWQGVGPGGEYGLFPANYVQLINATD